MIGINGLNKFREFFKEYNNNYVLIGGSACAIIFDEIGETFRATKDLDIVLIVENINDEFAKNLWNFIKSAGYEVEGSKDKKTFYRFTKPQDSSYPKMIELFSRSIDIKFPENVHLIPIHISDEISSLSAILLNEDYYQFMMNGRRIIDDISVLDEKYLIPFKAKAWCELIERHKGGEIGLTRHIKKHCKDISSLVQLLPLDTRVNLKGMVKEDMTVFVNDLLSSEFVPASLDVRKLHDILKKFYL